MSQSPPCGEDGYGPVGEIMRQYTIARENWNTGAKAPLRPDITSYSELRMKLVPWYRTIEIVFFCISLLVFVMNCHLRMILLDNYCRIENTLLWRIEPFKY